MSETISQCVAPVSRDGLEQVVVICAYCGRMRSELEDWRPAAPNIPPVLVSHGCCPDCFDREMAKCRVTIARAGMARQAVVKRDPLAVTGS